MRRAQTDSRQGRTRLAVSIRKALLSVVPVPNPRLRRARVILQGETPNPIKLPGGCRFHPRCPVAIEQCQVTDPAYVEVVSGHHAACLLVK